MVLRVSSCIGCYFFSANDPFHFANFEIALSSLYNVATGDNWIAVMYVNFWGCKAYTMNVYDKDSTWWRTTCTPGQEAGAVSFFFFATFEAIQMVLLSMFVGAVCMSMSTAVQTIHAEKLTDQKVRGTRATRGTLAPSRHIL